MSGGKRAASSELAEEPDAKAAKLDDSADAKEKPAELAEEAADQEGEDGDAAPTRRSSRARKAPVKGRDAPGKAAKGAEPKMVTVTYKEGDVLGEHLHAVGTLVEVKIPAESTVSGNPQVRARSKRDQSNARLERGRVRRRARIHPDCPPRATPGERPAIAATLELPDPSLNPRDRFRAFRVFARLPRAAAIRRGAFSRARQRARVRTKTPPGEDVFPPSDARLARAPTDPSRFPRSSRRSTFPTDQVRARQLWGTDTYTSDSDLVAVLMHRGYYLPSAATPPSLVELRAVVRAVAPLETYASTSRNGVRSRSWGAVRVGCSFAVESCVAVLSAAKAKERGGGGLGVAIPGEPAAPRAKGPGAKKAAAAAAAAADDAPATFVTLTPDPDRFAATTPTFFPNNVESVVNTRASAANSERRGKLVREVTVQYNLCNEPWLKYGAAAVADRGFKKSEWTAARLRRETLFLESHAHRYELSFEGDPEAVDDEGKGLASEDAYRFARCVAPKSLTETTRLGVPLPPSELADVKTGLKWSDVTFGAGSVVVKGQEVKVVRLQFMART
jgi:hypothetical protein